MATLGEVNSHGVNLGVAVNQGIFTPFEPEPPVTVPGTGGYTCIPADARTTLVAAENRTTLIPGRRIDPCQ